ncbi:methyltransferase domain-containing protein [Mesorhizobium sp.]|uniref:class I SAM-dependent methyltransferase n=1 Tax=Mesorhizobium sp. TaxID=1871066 RepID=UPI000FEAA357|nr:methyltransferase domain-containing protein [Mesorhizobium sp.]RWC38894.1 MAG: class I SAM-dependent methyltransferase [Mesorhizobium sp.]RWE95867.1 MAG: class I SAM-dependent methyltransferase [Mesorhizobium sp.]
MEVADGARVDVHVLYTLVHSDREIRRLSHQAGIINPITRRILLSAGIRPGMRVLHVGCGAGDVTFLVSEMVGSEGQVIGADRAPAALAAAEGRAAAHPIQKVSFHEGDPAALSFDRPFDAVIGRYVLIFQADAVAMLRGVARHLRPGGTVVFHEPDWNGCRSSRQRRPTTTAVDGSSRRSGAAVSRPIWVSSSMRLPRGRIDRALNALGSGCWGTRSGFDWSHQTAELIVTMLPEIQSRGVATAAEVDIETLGQRMQLEIEAGSVIVSRSEVGAWSRAPT